MLKKNIAIAVGLAISFGASAKIEGSQNDGNWVDNYLNPNKGSEVKSLTNIDEGSRWYYNARVKGSFSHTYESGGQVDINDTYLDGFLRLRGKSMLTEDVGFFGDFWLKARERVTSEDGEETREFDYFDDETMWNHFIFGFESNKYGSLSIGKHTATWALFSADIGVQGLMDSQMDAAGKDGGKLFYKASFDNNLFIHASHDVESEIHGVDIGYQNSNIYPYRAGAYGMYFSAHNGQPMLQNGTSWIVGNANPNASIESDTSLARNKDDLYTYSLSGFGQVGWEHRFAAILAYSEMDDADSADIIKNRGYALGGLGFSATASYAHYPVGFKGLSQVITVSNDEFGTTVAPQLDYYFQPGLKVSVAHVMNSNAQDTSKLEFQYDF